MPRASCWKIGANGYPGAPTGSLQEEVAADVIRQAAKELQLPLSGQSAVLTEPGPKAACRQCLD